MLILRVADCVALQKRPGTGLLAGLFEPPSLTGKLTLAEVQEAISAMGLSPLRIAPLGEGKHVFSHLEWHMTGYEVVLDEQDAANLPPALFLVPREKIDRDFALPSAYAAYRAFM